MTFSFAGVGTGSAQIQVSVGDAGQLCSSTCVVLVDAGTNVSVRVQSPNLGFETWSPANICGASTTCTFRVNGPSAQTAQFAPFNTVFVTSGKVVPGALGGRDGGDAFCMAHARDAGLGGNFMAYLNTDSQESHVRFANSRGWARLDGRPVFRDLDNALNGAVLYPPTLDERGRTVVPDGGTAFFTPEFVATGGYGPGSNCSGWTKIDAGTVGVGVPYSTHWYSEYLFGARTCDSPARLYCLETGRNVQVALPKPVARLAFRATGNFAPSGGLSGADNFCDLQAQDAGLPGQFVAFLGSINTTLYSRFDAGLGWARPDDVVWIPDATTFLSGHPAALSSGLNIDARGRYTSLDGVWTGYAFNYTPGFLTAMTSCDGWTSSSATSFGLFGYAGFASLAALLPPNGRYCASPEESLICMQK